MKFSTGFNLFWSRGLDFSGTSSRREFWFGVLANAIIMVILLAALIVSLTCFAMPINPFSITMIIIFALFCLIELIPSISLIFRRMHDIGKNGGYIFVLFIPIVGFVWYIYLVTRPSGYYKKDYQLR